VDPYKWRVCRNASKPTDSKTDQMENYSPVCGHLHNATVKYAFQTRSWHEAKFKPAILRTVLRQTDIEWIEHLERVSKGEVNVGTLEYLESLIRPLPERSDGIKPTRLYTRRVNVNEENALALEQLPGHEYTFQAVDSMAIFQGKLVKAYDEAGGTEKILNTRLMGPVRISTKHLQDPQYKSKRGYLYVCWS
jgi:hypothetical protein